MSVTRRTSRRYRPIRRIDLKKTLFVLPNLVTLASIFCGFNAMRVVATDNPSVDDFFRAAILLMFAMLFDLLDGRIARMTRTQSAFGLQLDSIADIISFGAAPSLLMYKWMLFRLPGGAFIAFLFTACGAIRLARFNVLSSSASGAPLKPGPYTMGLPIPPASGVLISLLLANHALGGALGDAKNAVAVAGVTLLVSVLMVSTVKFRSFKDLGFNIGTALLVLFAVTSSALVWRFGKPQFVLLWLLSFYILIGLFEGARALALRWTRPQDADANAENNSDVSSVP
ncbi:MAG TPA: CDP-diacylglycerol--serine O-phosphatidyltransferase [Polyangiaceae bacterium]|jgi:CDP-diacylglycerol--serine O-phosphatidyltransferase|nr:CDP-diacylglycerol--serine O-phosphatidyltransferase [Polyangiaceae bacterium]